MRHVTNISSDTFASAIKKRDFLIGYKFKYAINHIRISRKSVKFFEIFSWRIIDLDATRFLIHVTQQIRGGAA